MIKQVAEPEIERPDLPFKVVLIQPGPSKIYVYRLKAEKIEPVIISQAGIDKGFSFRQWSEWIFDLGEGLNKEFQEAGEYKPGVNDTIGIT